MRATGRDFNEGWMALSSMAVPGVHQMIEPVARNGGLQQENGR